MIAGGNQTDGIISKDFWPLTNTQITFEGPLSYKYIMTYVDVYESIHHKIITC